ncbi:large conductance mechanosensitive channel protein MscL [Eubacterium sp. AB3007]|uniref:large conductance mechanosensitive channel protein MscL n=1 Tax=Eubacterium sp. AB3007 TaxID=1392487 RepID=UPI000487FA92|nr:large conductance mechanosensitive channel protein MscL [Eubacterium sp. AB3007]
MKSFINEFKEFAMRGNVMDMAIGVIIGGAFGAIITALVDKIITPIIGAICGGQNFAKLAITIGEAKIGYGAFIQAVIDFLIVAFVLFLMLKAINKAMNNVKKQEEEEAPTTKVCPFCKSEIDIEATRCPHCTSEQPEVAEA